VVLRARLPQHGGEGLLWRPGHQDAAPLSQFGSFAQLIHIEEYLSLALPNKK
jgi:hypothetical protein